MMRNAQLTAIAPSVKEVSLAGTVREFKNLVGQKSGVGYRHWDFTSRSERHAAFWAKLNELGGRRMRELPPEQVPDIDATVTLTDDEWSQLEEELEELL